MKQPPSFFQLLEEQIDLNDFIPRSFSHAFYQSLGHKRLYPLSSLLSSLILQKIFSIPSDSLLFLSLCKELRDFCGFSKVPDAPLFTRFKQNFLPYIEFMFQRWLISPNPSARPLIPLSPSSLPLTPPALNSMSLKIIRKLSTPLSGGSNPTIRIILRLILTRWLMPSQAAASPDAKQMYINGHFCYADKFAILTNGLGIVRHITFLDNDFKQSHPELPVEKKSDLPEEDKSIGDSSCLKSVLADYFSLHPQFHPDAFPGDSAFDTIDTYGFLKEEFHFSKALIPYNPRNESSLDKVGYSLYGYPTCPNDPSLDMKYLGHCHEKGRADRDKWGCPKVHMVKGQ